MDVKERELTELKSGLAQLLEEQAVHRHALASSPKSSNNSPRILRFTSSDCREDFKDNCANGSVLDDL